MDRSSRSVIKRLEEAGFIHVRTRGSHHYFKKDGKPLICVPHPKKDLPIGTYKSIITQPVYNPAGFKLREVFYEERLLRISIHS